MPTLLLRLAGPLQAWGIDSKFEIRRTSREPSKSGVIGLLAAALGRGRDETVDDLNRLRFGVRVDKEGELLRDYHTARSVKQVYVTNRYYLSDAVFLVGLESEDRTFLETIEQAIQSPKFPLFLGRRSCVPSFPILRGIREKGLEEALADEPWLVENSFMQRRLARKAPCVTLRRVMQSSPDAIGAVAVRDVAMSFSPENRRYDYRSVTEDLIEIDNPTVQTTSHDIMAEL